MMGDAGVFWFFLSESKMLNIYPPQQKIRCLDSRKASQVSYEIRNGDSWKKFKIKNKLLEKIRQMEID